MSAPDLQSLFFIERDIELEFKRILAGGGAAENIFVSREIEDAQTPWLEVTFVVGRVTRKKQHARVAGTNLYYDDTWEGSQLELKIVTQRKVNGAHHKLIIGRARSLVTIPSLCGYPNAQLAFLQQYHAITDIREAGTTHGCDTDNDLDYSIVTFSVVHNIKADAWPVIPSGFSTYLRPDGSTYLRPDGVSRYIRP